MEAGTRIQEASASDSACGVTRSNRGTYDGETKHSLGADCGIGAISPLVFESIHLEAKMQVDPREGHLHDRNRVPLGAGAGKRNVSVVTPKYHQGCFLRQRIESVLRQTYRDFRTDFAGRLLYGREPVR
jgi:hypothetical protein